MHIHNGKQGVHEPQIQATMSTANATKPGKKQTNALASPVARQSLEQKPSHHHGTTSSERR